MLTHLTWNNLWLPAWGHNSKLALKANIGQQHPYRILKSNKAIFLNMHTHTHTNTHSHLHTHTHHWVLECLLIERVEGHDWTLWQHVASVKMDFMVLQEGHGGAVCSMVLMMVGWGGGGGGIYVWQSTVRDRQGRLCVTVILSFIPVSGKAGPGHSSAALLYRPGQLQCRAVAQQPVRSGSWSGEKDIWLHKRLNGKALQLMRATNSSNYWLFIPVSMVDKSFIFYRTI